MTDADPTMPGVGDVVDKYRIERVVGEGAMGRVYRAHHVILGHSVAIKFLRASIDTEETRARFIREAKATMALRSEHIVRVFDLGILPSKTPYMVLEFLEGVDLRTLLSTSGALPAELAVDYVLQACEALAEAHQNGIVHRDLKPQNLFLTRRANGTACIKLLDFGVSKVEEGAGDDHELTSSHVLLGSPAFMSPEQIRSSSRVDARADVWSLGIALYMLLGGGRPFDAQGLPALCASIMVDAPRPLASRCPSVPFALEEVILQCLEKVRERRLQNVAEVARALAPFASEEGRLSVDRVVHVLGTAAVKLEREPRLPAARPEALSMTGLDERETTAPMGELARAPMGAVARAPMGEPPPETSPVESTMLETFAGEVHVEPSPRRRAPRLAIGAAAIGAGLGLVALLLGTSGSSAAEATSTLRVGAEEGAIQAAAAVEERGEPPASAPAPSPPSESTSVSPSTAPDDEHAAPSSSSAAARGTGPRARASQRSTKPAATPVTATSAKRKAQQVDRNGVPILD